MPAITRVSDAPYRWKITEAPLSMVANVEKMLPRDYIAKDGFGITAKARALSRAADEGRGAAAVQRRFAAATCG